MDAGRNIARMKPLAIADSPDGHSEVQLALADSPDENSLPKCIALPINDATEELLQLYAVIDLEFPHILGHDQFKGCIYVSGTTCHSITTLRFPN